MEPFNILVVDDDPDILTIIRDNLELDGYTVYTAEGGKEAISLFKANAIDLIVLDLMLPDMDGIQVCRTTRNFSHVPIIMLTAKDTVADKVLGLESGADDYLVKPFEYLELAARIKARLRRSQAYRSEETLYRVKDLELIPERREAEIKGKKISLTRKEFDILSLLFRHFNRVLDRETIRAEIWPDQQLYKWSRALDVHILRLRTKLEENPDQPEYIVTVPGIGYMLRPPE